MHRQKLIQLAVCLTVVAAIGACGKTTETEQASTKLADNSPKTRALPYSIESVMLSDLFKDNLKVAKVNVGVTGGTPPEWAATSVAIAEKVAKFGVNSIEVSVRRNEITQKQGVMFRELAHTYYSPDPRRTVWDGDKPWAIYVANSDRLATQRDVEIFESFHDLNEKYIQKGMDPDAADKKAGAVIAKKFGLPKDWRLPIGNVAAVGAGINRLSLSVDAEDASSSMAALATCMDGKIIRMLSSCNR